MITPSKTIIYLHGFQSSSHSQKARILSSYLLDNNLSFNFQSPNLPFAPDATLELIQQIIDVCDNPLLMGSSMGGYYAAYFSQLCALPAVLINPVVDAEPLFRSLLEQNIENVYTGERYRFCNDDLEHLAKIQSVNIAKPELILNLLETGDEVLDYRLAQKKYKICRQKIFQGGDHRFQNFEICLPEIIQFYNSAS
jgi:predicted esterase YcpF (UPF0227 family)